MNNPSTHTFTNSLWDSTSSSTGGGAIYVSGTSSLTLNNCLFLSCKSSSSSSSDWFGGGAILFISTGQLSLLSALFLSCYAVGERGGAIHVRFCGDTSFSNATCVDCSCSTVGGGLLAEGCHGLALSNSIFINCRTQIGGACGFYERYSIFSVSNCIFGKNSASHSLRGGGAVEDNVYDAHYYCIYSYSFFTQNTADNGNDIAANKVTYTSSPIVHCFTTATTNGFCNSGEFQYNWLHSGTQWIFHAIYTSHQQRH